VWRLTGAILLAVAAFGNEYAGSTSCAGCHRKLFDEYRRTSMGRSFARAGEGEDAARFRRPAKVFHRRLNRWYEVFARDGAYWQSEYALDPAGKEIFRQTHKLAYVMGSGTNGVGYLIERDDYLFEAPLSWYRRGERWDLSPGYEDSDASFSRPVPDGCAQCHTGRPRGIATHAGRYEKPAFRELAIGCENCHGPGAEHVRNQMASSIVNPKKLAPALADQVCFGCHQGGEARTLMPGKTWTDLQAGKHTGEVFTLWKKTVPPGNNPEGDLLEHHFAMEMSACYRKSEGRMGCNSCHNPHEMPETAAARLSSYRAKCQSCHAQQGCSLPLAQRGAADDCMACHMPTRKTETISHSSLTQHRITRRAEQAWPAEAYVTKGAPGLRLLNDAGNTVPQMNLLETYGSLAREDEAGFRVPFLKQLLSLFDTKLREEALVQSYLASEAMRESSEENMALAEKHLRKRLQTSVSAEDTWRLVRVLQAQGKTAAMREALQSARAQYPWDRNLSRLEAELVPENAPDHVRRFPEDTQRYR
jgi:hypothetical protein